MKRTLLLLAVLASALCAEAKSLVLTLADGTRVYYLLQASDYYMMHLTDDGAVLQGRTIDWADFAGFLISTEDAPDAVTAPDATLRSQTRIAGDEVAVTGATAVRILDAAGRQLRTAAAAPGQTITISIGSLPVGTYIIATDKATTKFIKH